MNKILEMLLILLLVCPAASYAQDTPPAEPKQIIGGFGNGLGYGAQMQENWKRGTKEIADAPNQIEPSFKEQEHTKLGVPGFPPADGLWAIFLTAANVGDSLCRGVWRILVSPFPIIQKVQP